MEYENTHATLAVAPNGVGTLTICNAGSLNILGTPVIEGLLAALEHVARTPAVRVLIMRGHGDKAFVAGADIKEMAKLDQQSAAVFIEKLRQLCEGVRLLSIPVIARIPGWTLGGGLEFALACDLRIGSTAARLGMPEVQVGIPSIIHAALMPRLIGKARSSWMLLTGEVADAQQGLAWGLLDRVVEPDHLDTEITRVADGLAQLGTQVLAQQKRLLREWEDEPLEASIRNGVNEFAAAFTTGEPQRYMGKFVEEKARRAAAK
ncbi:enoyl-CoA hydratase [Pollutimonas subterranea]|uniref:Enoyl-CoA hydratase n=1 Tax=Pollutimonas subterranea TaxID=2045210 RepID=A0A2N4U6J1_9BURK|nr:enoyl-CoA hydratase [Pollutimonas subterranea]PLC50645.1 enoyl-CoA hydratase [Pollutimonas subterranea]